METLPSGPLVGLRVVEFVGLGPGPHCAMLLADLGAEVLRIDRPGGSVSANPVVDRGRSSITLDIGTEEGKERCLEVCGRADVLIEGFRPGVMERLGLGPDVLQKRNPRLVYGRVTGWGQEGPLAHAAGHDINYVALTGALAAIGEPGRPAIPPLNLVGDFGGGSMLMAFGIMAALFERQSSGKGQVVDAAIIDGVSSMMSFFDGLSDRISLDRASNLLGGAAPFYRCYVCADGKEISVGAIEPQFYREFIERIGAPQEFHVGQHDTNNWPSRSRVLADLFKTRPSAEWQTLLEGTDICFAPVLSLDEAATHPHMTARETYVEHENRLQVAPVPRFSRTPGRIQDGKGESNLLEGKFSWQDE